MIRVGINGILGRMGQELVQGLKASDKFLLVGGIDLHSPEEGGAYLVTEDAGKLYPRCDVIIDFSLPEGALAALENCLKYKKPLVTGTTGLSQSQLQKFRLAGREIPLVQSFNFSVGINLLLRLVQEAARVLGATADIEIVEKHHRMKKDAPSGTALMLAEKIARELNRSEQETFVFGRQGKNLNRGDEIGIHAVRGGSVVGEHTIYFLGKNENVTLSHQALNRRIFVDGALRAAEWVLGKPAGLYTMNDVLAE